LQQATFEEYAMKVCVDPGHGFIAFDKDRDTMLNPQIREDVCKAIADVLLT
jgi:N-acetylmuramoyl-L-alanine amidase